MRDLVVERLTTMFPPRTGLRCECCGVAALGLRAFKQMILVLRPSGSVVVVMRTCLSEYCKGTAKQRAGDRVDRDLLVPWSGQ